MKSRRDIIESMVIAIKKGDDVEQYKACDHCDGYGSSLKEENAKCTKCGGSGLVKEE